VTWTIIAIMIAVWMVMGKLNAIHGTLIDIHSELDEDEGGVDHYSEDDFAPEVIEPLSKLSKSR
jgi:hypothetical protein